MLLYVGWGREKGRGGEQNRELQGKVLGSRLLTIKVPAIIKVVEPHFLSLTPTSHSFSLSLYRFCITRDYCVTSSATAQYHSMSTTSSAINAPRRACTLLLGVPGHLLASCLFSLDSANSINILLSRLEACRACHPSSVVFSRLVQAYRLGHAVEPAQDMRDAASLSLLPPCSRINRHTWCRSRCRSSCRYLGARGKDPRARAMCACRSG